MKAKFVATNPDELEYRLEVTMTLANWKKLRRTVDTSYSGIAFRGVIDNMIDQAERNFIPPAP